jgi:hypothetical protein
MCWHSTFAAATAAGSRDLDRILCRLLRSFLRSWIGSRGRAVTEVICGECRRSNGGVWRGEHFRMTSDLIQSDDHGSSLSSPSPWSKIVISKPFSHRGGVPSTATPVRGEREGKGGSPILHRVFSSARQHFCNLAPPKTPQRRRRRRTTKTCCQIVFVLCIKSCPLRWSSLLS